MDCGQQVDVLVHPSDVVLTGRFHPHKKKKNVTTSCKNTIACSGIKISFRWSQTTKPKPWQTAWTKSSVVRLKWSYKKNKTPCWILKGFSLQIQPQTETVHVLLGIPDNGRKPTYSRGEMWSRLRRMEVTGGHSKPGQSAKAEEHTVITLETGASCFLIKNFL